MLAGHTVTLKIDLNMLRGDRIRARRDFVEGDSLVAELNEGDIISALDEEGDLYVAIIERVEGMRVYLRLDLDSRTPTEGAWSIFSPYSEHLETVIQPETTARVSD
jgi:hypothetical protein